MIKLHYITIAILILFTACLNNEIDYSDNRILCEQMYSMTENDQKFRAIGEMTDSLWKLQIKIDDYNCEQLIKIVKKRGWPSKESYTCDKHTGGVIILRHAQEKYFPQIQNLINTEFSAGRIGSGDYNFIKNHIMGRPPITIEELLEDPLVQ